MTTVILDPYWRGMDELFSAQARTRMAQFDLIWAKDGPIPDEVYQAALPTAEVLITATPVVTAETLAAAPNLRTVIEVSGAFPDSIDYAACEQRGVEVLSCAPGFRAAVAEMGLAMTLSAARGLAREHEAFRRGEERWLEDCTRTDFTLYGARLGFVGFGQIAQEMVRLLAPFGVQIAAYDPWLPHEVSDAFGVKMMDLTDLASWAKVLYVTAVPTSENAGLVSADVLAAMADQSVLIILSRAHLVDFDAVVREAASGRLTVATDVFPSEPLAGDHPIRRLTNVILSPHRAAAVLGGRQLIGDMICDDLEAKKAGRPDRRLTVANAERIASLAGVGDAASVEDMASKRS